MDTTTTRLYSVEILFRSDAALDRDGCPRRASTPLVHADYRYVASWLVPAASPEDAAEVVWGRCQNLDSSWNRYHPDRSMMIGDVVLIDEDSRTEEPTRLVADFVGFVPFTTWDP